MTCRPGHSPRHPDFGGGNLAAVKHGAFSPRVVATKVEEIEPEFDEWIQRVARWAAADEFQPARLNYLRSRAVVELLFQDIAVTAERLGTAKVPTRRFETVLSALRGERDALSALGLTPPTKAQLANTVADTATSLEELAQRGAQAMAERPPEAPHLAPEPLDVAEDTE